MLPRMDTLSPPIASDDHFFYINLSTVHSIVLLPAVGPMVGLLTVVSGFIVVVIPRRAGMGSSELIISPKPRFIVAMTNVGVKVRSSCTEVCVFEEEYFENGITKILLIVSNMMTHMRAHNSF